MIGTTHPATMQQPLSVLQRRTLAEVEGYRRFERQAAGRLDLRELINSKLPQPFKVGDQRSLDAFAEISEACRQRHGTAPNGTFLPLTVLHRDLTTGTAANAVVPSTSNLAGDALLPLSGVVAGGATMLSGLEGSTFTMPGVDATIDATSGWLSEGGEAPQLESTFKGVAITPHSLAVQMVVSMRLLQNTSVDLDALLRRELAERISLAIDRAAIQGSGTNQPLGILSNSGLEVVAAGANGLAPTYAHTVELEHRVMSRIAGQYSNAQFLTSPNLAKRLRLTPRVTGGDRFILDGADMLGYPVRQSTSVPDNLTKGTSAGICSALLFGDLSEIVVGWWGPAAVDFLVDSYTLRHRGAVRIVARADVGVGVRRIGAFAAYKDLLSA